MNYVIFVSIGVFVALFLVIAGHYDVGIEKPSDFRPNKVVAVIESKHRKNVMIAKEKYGIEVNPIQIANSPDETSPIVPVSYESPKEKEVTERDSTGVFTSTGLYELLKDTVKNLFSREK